VIPLNVLGACAAADGMPVRLGKGKTARRWRYQHRSIAGRPMSEWSRRETDAFSNDALRGKLRLDSLAI
jgi:hypothetical protein